MRISVSCHAISCSKPCTRGLTDFIRATSTNWVASGQRWTEAAVAAMPAVPGACACPCPCPCSGGCHCQQRNRRQRDAVDTGDEVGGDGSGSGSLGVGGGGALWLSGDCQVQVITNSAFSTTEVHNPQRHCVARPGYKYCSRACTTHPTHRVGRLQLHHPPERLMVGRQTARCS